MLQYVTKQVCLQINDSNENTESALGIPEIIIIGLALSMDAFAVTISNTFVYPHASRARLLAMPIVFGVFQGLMPVLGFLLGSVAADLINQYAGIISLLILGIIGGKMIKDGIGALRNPAEENPEKGAIKVKILLPSVLLAQAVATSIDAFVVGVSFLAQGANIAIAAPIVTLTTAVCCLIAVMLGKRFGVLLGNKAQILGGIVLVLIGLKAFFL